MGKKRKKESGTSERLTIRIPASIHVSQAKAHVARLAARPVSEGDVAAGYEVPSRFLMLRVITCPVGHVDVRPSGARIAHLAIPDPTILADVVMGMKYAAYL